MNLERVFGAVNWTFAVGAFATATFGIIPYAQAAAIIAMMGVNMVGLKA